MLKLSPAKRIVALVALVSSVIAVGAVAAPGASAQENSRLCGYLLTKDNPSAPGPDHYLYLTEVDKNSDEPDWHTGGREACEGVLDYEKQGYHAREAGVYEYYYSVCENVSEKIGWSKYQGRPAGSNPNDICQSMHRDWDYLVGYSGEVDSPQSSTRVTEFSFDHKS